MTLSTESQPLESAKTIPDCAALSAPMCHPVNRHLLFPIAGAS